MAHPNGRFVWFEYMAKDISKAQGFFGELFHWKTQQMPAQGAPGGNYSMITVQNQTIGGYVPHMEGAPPQGHWLSHLGVDNAVAACQKVKQLGGKVRKEPVKMGDYGTWALVADPFDATFVLWQPAKAEGTGDYKELVGSFCWNELMTDQPEKAVEFYKTIGGFTEEKMPMGEHGTYHVLMSEGKRRAGIMKKMSPQQPNAWLPYVNVASADQTAEKAKKLGSQIVAGPEDIPNVGRFAVLIDPQGGALGVLQPNPR